MKKFSGIFLYLIVMFVVLSVFIAMNCYFGATKLTFNYFG